LPSTAPSCPADASKGLGDKHQELVHSAARPLTARRAGGYGDSASPLIGNIRHNRDLSQYRAVKSHLRVYPSSLTAARA
jgi:hypothetical protein